MLKIGYTTIDTKERIKQQYPIKRPIQTWKLVFEHAMKKDGSIISDDEVRNFLKKGFKYNKKSDGEWIKCKEKDVKSALLALKTNDETIFNRVFDFKLRPEQKEAVKKQAYI